MQSTADSSGALGDSDGVMLYSLPDVAGLLGVSLNTVRRLVREGAVPAVRVRRVLRVRSSDLRDYVERLAPVARKVT